MWMMVVGCALGLALAYGLIVLKEKRKRRKKMADKEYIEREAVMQKFADHVKRNNNRDFAPVLTWNQAVQIVEDFPAADVRPVVRGRWVDEPIKGIRYHCSVCQGRFDYTWRFCPNCGADMREES